MAGKAETEDERDLTVYADKEPTDLQERFAEWIPEQTGYSPNGAKNKLDAFNAGVRLATALRMIFQASPENQAALEGARKAAEVAKAEREEAKAERARKAAEKPAKEEAEAPKKATPRKGTKAAAAEAPAPAKATRRPAKKAAAKAVETEEDAPF